MKIIIHLVDALPWLHARDNNARQYQQEAVKLFIYCFYYPHVAKASILLSIGNHFSCFARALQDYNGCHSEESSWHTETPADNSGTPYEIEFQRRRICGLCNITFHVIAAPESRRNNDEPTVQK